MAVAGNLHSVGPECRPRHQWIWVRIDFRRLAVCPCANHIPPGSLRLSVSNLGPFLWGASWVGRKAPYELESTCPK